MVLASDGVRITLNKFRAVNLVPTNLKDFWYKKCHSIREKSSIFLFVLADLIVKIDLLIFDIVDRNFASQNLIY